jgi:hypothetical protein
MLATFAFDVCHDVYLAAREVIDTKIPTLSLESAGKYQWHPDRLPRLAEFVADFARAGERALGGGACGCARGIGCEKRGCGRGDGRLIAVRGGRVGGGYERRQAEACPTRAALASRMAMFRVYYLGGAEYQAARRHLGISELTWADWSEEIRTRVGRELASSGVFPPSKYFREMTARAS